MNILNTKFAIDGDYKSVIFELERLYIRKSINFQ